MTKSLGCAQISDMSILSVKNLTKSFKPGLFVKETQVLKGMSFDLVPGEITGFLGSNGSGKTTTLKCLLEIVQKDSGEVRFFDQTEFSAQIKSRIGFLPEHPYFYDYLTAQEFLQFYGRLSGMKKDKELSYRIDELLENVGLVFAKERRLRDFSKGMLQKIGLAQAIIHNPDLVILDEPMSGLDPDGRMALSKVIRTIADQGKTIFFSSHLLFDTQEMCKNLVIVKDGAVAYEGKTQGLLDRSGKQFKIKSRHDGQMNEVVVENVELAQEELKRLIAHGHEVLSVEQDQLSLEEIFIESYQKRSV